MTSTPPVGTPTAAARPLPRALPPSPAPSSGAPAGWTPACLVEAPSARRDGMVAAIVDAWRGIPEPGNGQPLTPAQVSAIAPFLAAAFGLPVADVTAALADVHLYLGGPAAHTPWNAVTIGRDIYVRSPEELNAIESWDHRRWLVHECGHVCQHERVPATPDALKRLRRSMRSYGVRMVVDARHRPGAVPRGIAWWADENLNPRNPAKTHISLSQAIHDSHDLEIEAEKHAEDFARSTRGPRSPGHFDRGRV